jgi:nitroreductase
MDVAVAPVGRLTGAQVRSVLIAAATAPSPHDSRSWRFHCTAETIELYADPLRTGLGQQEPTLSCGAALLNLRLAIRALGVRPAVQLLPDPHRPDLLAIVRPQGDSPLTPDVPRLVAAMSRVRTDPGPFRAATIPPPILAELRQAARTERAWMLTVIAEDLPALRGLVDRAHQAQRSDPIAVAESLQPTAGAHQPRPHDEQNVGPDAMIVVIGTLHDQPLARLQAGQAMQRVLLTATAAGLSASPLTPVVEVPETRKSLREQIVGGLWPQAVLRLGG